MVAVLEVLGWVEAVDDDGEVLSVSLEDDEVEPVLAVEPVVP